MNESDTVHVENLRVFLCAPVAYTQSGERDIPR